MVSGGSRGEDDGMLFRSGMQQFLVREKYRQSLAYLALRLKMLQPCTSDFCTQIRKRLAARRGACSAPPDCLPRFRGLFAAK